MREGSSPRGDTTGSTYTDLAAVTPEAYAIASASRSLARERLGNATPEDRIRQRCSIAVGDFAMADLMRFSGGPVEAGVAALEHRAPIIVDIRMVQAGVLRR
ncbi:MAG TPA: precorrin-8X methylmutase, partial [Methanoculleus sp.]|nr:precorrin-8X methylmutase [Methanoculleus sp.]